MRKIATSYCVMSHDILETTYNKDPFTFHFPKYKPQRTHHQKVERQQRQKHGVRVEEDEKDIRAALWKN